LPNWVAADFSECDQDFSAVEDSILRGCDFLTLKIKALVLFEASVLAYTRHSHAQAKGRASLPWVPNYKECFDVTGKKIGKMALLVFTSERISPKIIHSLDTRPQNV
jgi:hypothetical protein